MSPGAARNLRRKVVEMTSDSNDKSHKERVQHFAQGYCERHNQKSFCEETGIPETTISQTLYRKGGFGPKTHRRVVQWIEKTAADLHERGLPLALDGVELPLEPKFVKSLGLSADQEDEPQAETPSGEEVEAIHSVEYPSEESPEDGHDHHGAGETQVIVPQGVSVTLPELRGEAAELWNRAELFGDDYVSEDLEKIFAISRMAMPAPDVPHAGWTGPHPPDDVAFQLDEGMHVRLEELLEHWQRHASAYEITKDVPRFAEHYAFLYIRRRMLEIEVQLINDFWLTHPESETPWQDRQRSRELEWRYELIPQLHRVEYYTNLEILMAATIWVVKRLLVAPVRGVARLLGQLFRRPQRNAAGS